MTCFTRFISIIICFSIIQELNYFFRHSHFSQSLVRYILQTFANMKKMVIPTKQVYSVRIALSLLLIILPVWVWSQGFKKHFKEGRFAECLKVSVQKIEEKPNKKGPQKDLGKIYYELWDSIQAKQEFLVRATQSFIGDETASEAELLLNNYKNIHKASLSLSKLGLMELRISKKETVQINIPDQTPKIDAAEILLAKVKEKAADMHYRQGLFHLQYKDLDRQKAAFMEFKRVMYFSKNYLDVKAKYKEAQKGATKRIILLPYANYSGHKGLGSIGGQISAGLASKLTANAAVMEFLEIITEGKLRAALEKQNYSYSSDISEATAEELREKLQAHELYIGRINQILSPEPEISSSDEEHEAKVVVGTTKVFKKETNEEVEVDIEENRTAYYKQYEATYVLTLTGAHTKISETGTKVNNFSETDRFYTYWTAQKSGNAKVYNKIKRSRQAPPSDGERVNKLIKKIVDKLFAQIKSDLLRVVIPVIDKIDQMNTQIARQDDE